MLVTVSLGGEYIGDLFAMVHASACSDAHAGRWKRSRPLARPKLVRVRHARSAGWVYCAGKVDLTSAESVMGTSHLFGQLIVSIVAACMLALPVSEAFGRDRGGGGKGGGGHHHGARPGWGGAGWGAGYWGPGFWGWPHYGYGLGWPSGYAYPGVVVVATNTADAVPRTVAAEWYYCPDSRLFFPHASKCPSGWQTVPTSTTPTTRPTPSPAGPPPQ